MNDPVKILIYRWAGSWGPFKVSIPCGECTLTNDVVLDTMQTELEGVPAELEVRDWLSHWWRPLLQGGWHAPIVMVEGKIVSQGKALNRGVLTQTVIEAHAARSPMSGNALFGKASCPHCTRAKGYLQESGVEYDYFDVVKQPRAMYEMLARVKPIVGPKTPITVPQIWLKNEYIGGADRLSELLSVTVEPNTDRGWCSISPGRLAANA